MEQQGFLDTPIEYLKGVGPVRGELLRKELSVSTCGELLSCFPFRYVDRSRFHRISDIADDRTFVQLRAVIRSVQILGPPRAKRIVATVSDGTGDLDLVWFKGHQWVS